MAKNLRPGDVVNGYEIVERLGAGNFAISYRAQKDGRDYFFKQYKCPSVRAPWYEAYVRYQAEMKTRIEGAVARNFCHLLVEGFETRWGYPHYFQVFEYIQGGHDLREYLTRIGGAGRKVTWEQRVLFAKVLMAAMSALHDAGVVHSDLKPENIFLFEDSSIAAKYRLRVIDLDFSLLADKQAPWHGHEGYFGTPGYRSPEHVRGNIPVTASDVFTCGLILHELLTPDGQNPYGGDENALLFHRAKPPRLAGTMPLPARNEKVSEVLHACLNPAATKRPTAREVNQALNGRAAGGTGISADGRLELSAGGGKSIRFGVRTEVGGRLCRHLGAEAAFLAEPQFVLDKDDSGRWAIEPNTASQNETLLNGKAISKRTSLKEGDVIAVGRESKGVAKLPLTVRLI